MERTPPSFAAIHAALFARLVQGGHRPSQRIRIDALARSLGVSTTPVREALRQLVGRDLLVDRHREGFYLAALNARAVASLYRAHGEWLQQAIARTPARSSARHPRGLWRLFDAAATDSGDVAIIAVRRYLDDRLAVLRRHEAAILGDMVDRGTAFAQALAGGDRSALSALAADFHERCIAAADRIADAFNP